jgi:hypothetical protein
LLCLKGEALYIVRGGGEGPQKRLTTRWDYKDFTITGRDGRTSYVIKKISPDGERRIVSVDINGPLEYQQYCDIALSEDPDKAPLAHFHGPLMVQSVQISWQLPPNLALRRGDKPTDLQAYVGTLDAVKGCWVVVQAADRYRPGIPLFPEGVHPVAEVEFPSQSPGAPPIKRIYSLDKTC